MMNDADRLQLKKLINENKETAVDQTNLIRQLKHSHILRDNVQSLIDLKEKYKDDDDSIQLYGISECSFLFNYYTDIYNKIKNDEINLEMLYKFFDVLEKIENNEIDQHEASFEIGTVLKEIYVDSALKKENKLDNSDNTNRDEIIIRPVSEHISYKEYKKQYLEDDSVEIKFDPTKRSKKHKACKKNKNFKQF